jgi:hypothetical protein
MVFKDKKQLERFLLKKCRLALLKAQDEVCKIIKQFLYQYYADYDPVMYERTYQLLSSLVESRIVSDGKGYRAEVYYNFDGLNYETGSQPSGKQVMDAAAYGGHGATGLKIVYGSGKDIWYEPLEIIDAEAINILKKMLIAEGIPIK